MCLEQSERGGQREEGRAGRGRGREGRALWPAGRTWALTRERWEPWRAVGRGGFGCHQYNSSQFPVPRPTSAQNAHLLTPCWVPFPR